MTHAQLPTTTKVDWALLALSAVLLAWALNQRFGAGDVSSAASGSVLITAAMTCNVASALVRKRAICHALMGCAAALLLSFFITH